MSESQWPFAGAVFRLQREPGLIEAAGQRDHTLERRPCIHARAQFTCRGAGMG